MWKSFWTALGTSMTYTETEYFERAFSRHFTLPNIEI